MTRISSFANSNSTDALFRLWINEIHNALIAFGWIRTADTGQIDFATVTRPTAINTMQGYALYRMDDALQATCPVFIKLQFGTGASTDRPTFKVQVAIGGTDGAGTLTGNISTLKTLDCAVAVSLVATGCRCYGTTSSFSLAFWHETTVNNGQLFLFIERDRDTAGDEVSLGVNFLTMAAIASQTSQFIELAGGLSTEEPAWRALLSSQTNQTAGGVTGVAPVRVPYGPMRNPMMSVCLFAKTDFNTNTTNPVTIYGASHTYLMLQGAAAWALNGVTALCGVAMRWE